MGLTHLPVRHNDMAMISANAVIMCVLLSVLPIGKLTAQPENQAPAPPEFTELKNGYEKARAKIEVDMQTKLMQLNGQYTGALDKLIVKFSQQGNLDGALVVRNEKNSIVNGVVPDKTEEPVSPSKQMPAGNKPVPSGDQREIPKTGSVYLCDLPVVKQTADRFVKGDPELFTVNDKSVRHGILAWAPSEVVFDITGLNGQSLEGMVGISPANENSLMRFELYGDDKLIWSSEVMKQDTKKSGVSQTQDFNVKISGVKTLSLKVDPLGSMNSDHAIWMDPKIVRSR